jgi:hypothetical protein
MRPSNNTINPTAGGRRPSPPAGRVRLPPVMVSVSQQNHGLRTNNRGIVGRLGDLATKALRDHAAGKTKPP